MNESSKTPLDPGPDPRLDPGPDPRTDSGLDSQLDAELHSRARAHAALGDPARLRIVDALQLGDASPGELADLTGMPTNLLAHHLLVLQQAGLIDRGASHGDRRRTYVRLRRDVPLLSRLTNMTPATMQAPQRVLFVCTANAARSQLAAAQWRRRSRIPGACAGTHPAQSVHPQAIATGRRHGLALDEAATTALADQVRPHDLIVAVCDQAHEELTSPRAPAGNVVRAVFTDRPMRELHWSVPDPAQLGTDEAFESAYEQLADRIERLLTAFSDAAVAPPPE